jgi:hypothetical protein
MKCEVKFSGYNLFDFLRFSSALSFTDFSIHA